MRTFELIHEYIGSPRLGTTANYTGDIFDKDNDLLPSVVCDKHFFKFWKEIIKVEKDYKIISFRNNGDCQDWKDTFNSNTHIILSIQRLSDNEIFTIGDTIDIHHKFIAAPLPKIINKIEIINDEAVIFLEPKGESRMLLRNCVKLKQPLFTTYDGIDIFEGHFAYECARNKSIFNHVNKFTPLEQCRDTYKTIGIDWIVFSTKEAAEEYILMNKPCLSITEVVNFKGSRDSSFLEMSLKELVKSKL